MFSLIELEDADLKERFAEAFLRHPDDPYRAAQEIFPGNKGKASLVAAAWSIDPAVIAFMNVRREREGLSSLVPTKEQFALLVYTSLKDISKPELRLAYMKLYADVQGFIEKPSAGGVNITNTNAQQNNGGVFEVPTMPADEDEWEARAMASQAKLVKDASA